MTTKIWKFVAILVAVALVGVLVPMSGLADVAEPDQPDLALLRGMIETMPEDGYVGTWQVGGIPVQVDENTFVSDRVGTPTQGSWVKVIGAPDGNGGVNAEWIKVIDPMTFPSLLGQVDSVADTAMSVAGVAMQVNQDTLMVGNIQQGTYARVLYEEQADGTLMAVQVREMTPDGLPVPTVTATPVRVRVVSFKGTVQEIPDGRIGTWRIGDKDVLVTANTWIDEHKGPATEGALVKVLSLQNDAEDLVAIRIVVERSAVDVQMPYTHLTGVIEALPADGLQGTWVVSGHNVQVTANTLVDARRGTPEVGDIAHVVGYAAANNEIVATRITVVKHQQMPVPTATPSMTPQPPHPTHTPQPPHPTHTPQPPMPTHTPQPPHPTHTPQPPMPTHTPQPPMPTHTPQPPMPTHTPQPPHPTHTPQPPHPTHTPQPPAMP